MIYTKEFLIDAFLWRYTDVIINFSTKDLDAFVTMTTDFYNASGKDKFRTYASLDAEEIKKFRLATGC